MFGEQTKWGSCSLRVRVETWPVGGSGDGQKWEMWSVFLKREWGTFPGGAKNPLANTGKTGLIPGLARSHVLQSSSAPAPQLLSLCAAAITPACLEPMLCNKRTHLKEKPMHRNEE